MCACQLRWLMAATLTLATLLALQGLARAVPLGPEDDLPPCNLTHLNSLIDIGNVSWRVPQRTSQLSLPLNGSSAKPPPQLQLRHCRLRRLTVKEARECLADRPLVIVGDSVTRYQFVSLIHFLEFGTWPPPTTGSPGRPSPLIEAEWAVDDRDKGSWPRYFKGTTEMFNGTQQCHCYRKIVGSHIDIREDRFYRSGRVSASFYFWSGHPYQPLQGRWAFPPFNNGTACEPGMCDPSDWSLPLYEAIRKVIARLKPATFVFNSGLWRAVFGGSPWEPEVYEAIMSAIDAAVAPQGGISIWKATTWTADGRVPRNWDARALQHAADHSWRVMDAWAVTRTAADLEPPPFLENDTLHTLGYVYEELNHFLLNMICPTESPASAATDAPNVRPARPFLQTGLPQQWIPHIGIALFILTALILFVWLGWPSRL